MTPAEQAFATAMVAQAKASAHPWPGYAAAEAFLESASYTDPTGMSGLAQHTFDVFGLKEPSWWTSKVYDEQTREVVAGVSKMVDAEWPVFASYADAFAARLKVLQALPSIYGEALEASTGEEFVRLVSASWNGGDAFPVSPAHPVFTFTSGTYQFNAGRWSTAPNRASAVIATYNSHPDIFGV